MILKKMFFVLACAVFAATGLVGSAAAQERERVVKPNSSRPTNLPPVITAEPEVKTKTTSSSRPVLTTPINVVPAAVTDKPLVKKTALSAPVEAGSAIAAGRTVYGAGASSKIMAGIQARYGIPYRYGTTGPNTYDCSGFVWSVFNEGGVNIPRTSVRGLWAESEEVYGDDRFKFGTLVFLNGLGHIGIVADENGFYHASSSKGIMYSPFKGYWSNRIVGYRRWKKTASPAVKEEK